MAKCSITSVLCHSCAAQLGIPDIIHNHGRLITLPRLVSALHIAPNKTSIIYRLMRMLVNSGFFATTKAANGQGEGKKKKPMF
uniref:O-methyltransferase dimerisation domain-containing protein n=1 Tax=Salix viminalis TaxID=40686 RepID=A0A6N2L837_SALVM